MFSSEDLFTIESPQARKIYMEMVNRMLMEEVMEEIIEEEINISRVSGIFDDEYCNYSDEDSRILDKIINDLINDMS